MELGKRIKYAIQTQIEHQVWIPIVIRIERRVEGKVRSIVNKGLRLWIQRTF